jgi:hypothetical protein
MCLPARLSIVEAARSSTFATSHSRPYYSTDWWSVNGKRKSRFGADPRETVRNRRVALKKAARSRPSLTRVLSLRAAESAITRMDARRKLLLFRDPPEKVRELRPLRLVKGGA